MDAAVFLNYTGHLLLVTGSYSWLNFCSQKLCIIQQNLNGSSTFGTMKICSSQGQFELMGVNQSAKSGGIIGIYFRLSVTHIFEPG